MFQYILSLTLFKTEIYSKKAKRIVDTYDDGFYEGPAKVKEVNLVGP